jgi:hypothetical protein
MRIVAAALLLYCLGSCSPDESALQRRALIGRWAIDGQACDSAWLVYRRDGSWTTGHNGGRWSLADDRLTMKVTNWGDLARGQAEEIRPYFCHTEHIRWIGPDQFVTRWEDGSKHRLNRCDSRQRPIVQCIGDCTDVTPFDQYGWAERPPAATRRCR